MRQEILDRNNLIAQLVEIICEEHRPHPLRVAIDGVDGVGKTYLADELIDPIEKQSRTIIRASSDSFHHSSRIRYKRGKDSPEGYYHDSFNYEAIISELLKPLGPDGNRKYRRSIYDYRKEQYNQSPILIAPKDSVLLFDGIFLHRPELIQYWDFSIFVEANFKVAVERAIKRDMMNDGDEIQKEEYFKRYWQRYVPGQMIYLEEVKPRDLASLVVDNNKFDEPFLIGK